ncbi:AfsR/SARP family transcriptional regulator [Spongiactinospora rosea]|uniref:AfsR/SARP family transcriptional regulator n=1 Tax=Spongiactinospora rosea TaxID=2248750 RepID=UPI0013150140|nr:tetratricopeptide repeat protein [Spongiactinospora rosea]
MEFRILGSVEMWAEGQMRDLGTAKERYVLAILLLTPGQPVLIENIIDWVWGDTPPTNARGNLYTYVHRLRGRIGDDKAVLRRSGGYVLNVDPEQIDLHRFHRLNDRARTLAHVGNTDEALRLFNEAAELWRGEPLSGLHGEWISTIRTSLESDHQAATKMRLQLELDAGHHTEVLGELYRLVDGHPYDESFIEQLMIALYRCGRQRDALETYHRMSHRMVEQLGTDPAPSLRAMYQRILRGDPELAAPHIPPPAPSAPVTQNLPRDIPDFTGREADLRHLYEALDTGLTAVTIEAIDGMAGIGKSALAIHAAHALADRYKDGRWFLSLRAHDPNHPPLSPAEGLQILLRDIGENPRRIPEGLEPRAALWRARLAERRMLIVLDDAADADQVRPFLPGAPGCLVLITSRRRLTGLEGIRPLSLDVLAPHDASLLFRRIVGHDRPLAAPDVNRLVQLCGHLPLAVTIMADRLRHRPARAVGDFVTRLSQDRLAEMHTGDNDLTSTFELSYRELSRPRQRAFRRLSLHIGADFTAASAAAMIGSDLRTAERALEELLDHHLIQEPHSGRFRFHDLLREYARRRASEEESPGELRHVVHRLLDFYLYTADQADRALYPHRRRTALWIARPPADPLPVSDPDSAAEWLRTERDNLLSCAYHAAEHGLPSHTVNLSIALATYLERSAHWADAARLHETARRLSQKTGDRGATAHVELELSLIRSRTGRYHDAMELAQHGLTTFRALGDLHGEADVLCHLSRVCWHTGRSRLSLAYADKALNLYQHTKDRYGEGKAHLHRGIALFHLGRTEEAASAFQRSLDIVRVTKDRATMALALNNLGDLELDRGNLQRALDLFRESLATLRAAGWRQNEAVALNNIANVLRRQGALQEALYFYRQALSEYQATGDRRNETDAHNNIGASYLLLNLVSEALTHFHKALTVAEEIGDPYGQALALRGLGDGRQRHGQYDLAYETYERALAIAREVDNPLLQAGCLQGLGEALLHTKGRDQAEIHWREALAIYERLGSPEAEAVRASLRG